MQIKTALSELDRRISAENTMTGKSLFKLEYYNPDKHVCLITPGEQDL